MFKVWKKSMKIRYFIDAIFIIIIACILQYYMSELQTQGVQWYKVVPLYQEKLTALNRPNLTTAERNIAQQEFNEVEIDYLKIGTDAYFILIDIYKIMAVMISYSFRNI